MEPIVNIPEKKFLISIRTDLLKENKFQEAKIDGKLLKLKEFGMDDNFFGGNVFTIAKLKNKPYYLLVNKTHETIGICMPIGELDKLTKEQLKLWADNFKIKIKDLTKEQIIEKLTA